MKYAIQLSFLIWACAATLMLLPAHFKIVFPITFTIIIIGYVLAIKYDFPTKHRDFNNDNNSNQN